jgi:hypothetical protein
MATKKLITLQMTRRQALEQGLLVCKCGHPENNHFDFGDGDTPCAHCSHPKCTKYREVARSSVGTLIEPVQQTDIDELVTALRPFAFEDDGPFVEGIDNNTPMFEAYEGMEWLTVGMVQRIRDLINKHTEK